MIDPIVEKYIESQPIKPKTGEDRKITLDKLDEFLDKSLTEVKRRDVERWLKKKRDKDGISASSLNQYLSYFKDFYDWLSAQEFILEDKGTRKIQDYRKITRIGRFSEGNKDLIVHNLEEIKKFLNNIDRDFRVKFLKICYYFGLRRNEARLLKADDVDLENQKIHIRRETTKTESGKRLIPFHSKMKKYLDVDDGYVIGRKTRDGPYCESTFFWGDYDNILPFHVTNRQLRRTFNQHMYSRLFEEVGEMKAFYITKKLMGHKIQNGDMTRHHTGIIKEERDLKEKAMKEWHYLLDEGIL